MPKMKKKVALVTGITGQDGSYLAELLLSNGYIVHGIIRRSSVNNTSRIEHLCRNPLINEATLFLHFGDLDESGSLRRLIYKIAPEEIYNLASQSHVKVSFDVPEYTANITGLGALRILDAIKDYQENTGRKIKFYQASSSEMFGSAPAPQNERTSFHPRSMYACAKVFAHHATVNYREAYGIFAVSGILFNHESPRRGESFVTRKITRGVARIVAGLDKKIHLGNLDARRDWGYAPEFVEAIFLTLQQKKPEDFVIGTGETHSVREFAELAFKEAGLGDYRKYIVMDKRYYRPTEVNNLVADSSKAKKYLGWSPRTKFNKLVRLMMEAELDSISRNIHLNIEQ